MLYPKGSKIKEARGKRQEARYKEATSLAPAGCLTKSTQIKSISPKE